MILYILLLAYSLEVAYRTYLPLLIPLQVYRQHHYGQVRMSNLFEKVKKLLISDNADRQFATSPPEALPRRCVLQYVFDKRPPDRAVKAIVAEGQEGWVGRNRQRICYRRYKKLFHYVTKAVFYINFKYLDMQQLILVTDQVP